MPGIIFSKIISGGQTGVNRAALDVAIEIGIPCGGWCPKGRRAEDGPIDPKYPLKETKSQEYQIRSDVNVISADGTLILTIGKLTEGTAYTAQMALKYRKPHLVVDLEKKIKPKVVFDWAEAHKIRVLNVAGPRESKKPGIYEKAKQFLQTILVGKE
jgi:predicted Rossmann-fold nucleotide-binding protein